MRDSIPDPKQFRDPQVWATWMYNRDPQFKTHSTEGMCKTAIGGKKNNGVITTDIYVYKWDEDACLWAEVAYIAQGTPVDGHAFLRKKASGRSIKAPSEKAVNEAINSIRAVRTEEVQ